MGAAPKPTLVVPPRKLKKPAAGKPELVTVTAFGKKVTVNKTIAAALLQVDAFWKSKGGNAWYPIKSIGGYSDRNIAGTDTKSWHAQGLALDINPATNAVNAKKYDMPQELVAAFKQAGFGWGGDWTSKKDYMHFSAAPNEGGRLVSPSARRLTPSEPGPQVADTQSASAPDFSLAQFAGDPQALVREVWRTVLHRDPTDIELSTYGPHAEADIGKLVTDVTNTPEARQTNVGLGLSDVSERLRKGLV